VSASARSKSSAIGPLKVYRPGRGLTHFWFSHELARLFGVKDNAAAAQALTGAVARTRGLDAKSIEVAHETDAVTVRAKTAEAMVSVVRVTFALAQKTSGSALAAEGDYVTLLHSLSPGPRPKEHAFSAGALFAVPLQNGEHAFGWVLRRSGVSVTCALFDHRSADASVDASALVALPLISVVDFLADPLIYGEWPVIGHALPGFWSRLRLWLRGDRNYLAGGSETFEGLANAWHGLTPWNVDEGYEFALRRGVKRPPTAKVLSRDARVQYRIDVGLDAPATPR
jgi:hypothetical protein